MNAVLLAAGLGTRLRPLTDVLPKCLAPIRGRPLLEYWFHLLFEGGISRVLVNTHSHAALVESYIRQAPWFGRITIAHEERLLGTGGTLLANADFIGNAPVLVAHADNLTSFDLLAFLAAHATRPRSTALTMMTFNTSAPSSCGIVTTNEAGIVTDFYEKVADPPGQRANAAVYVLEQEVIKFIQNLHRDFVDISTDVLPSFVGRMATWHNHNYHRDIGSLRSWRAAQRDYPLPAPAAPKPDPWRAVLRGLTPNGLRILDELGVT
jgi:mannose-1-phosphate guanylyltransferase